MKAINRSLLNQNGSAVIWILAVLAIIWIGCLFWGRSGWGYPGYFAGRVHSPSFFYFGAPGFQKYKYTSVRAGSVAGPSHLGGGPGAGK